MSEVIYKEGVPLGRGVSVGQTIKTSKGWRKILGIGSKGIEVKSDILLFGELIYGIRV